MISDIMLPLTELPGEENAVESGIALAAAYRAHLMLVLPLSRPAVAVVPWGGVPIAPLEGAHLKFREEVSAKASALRDRLSREDISWEVRVEETDFSDPARTLARQARYADLLLVQSPAGDTKGAASAHACFNAMLFESGRPILTIPANHPISPPFRRAMLAWNASREATRALHDALSLLPAGGCIDVVMVDHRYGNDAKGREPGADVALHLARRDVRAEIFAVPAAGRLVSEALMRHALESDAQLLIAGGYGHSRLREWMLGGTTRELFESSRIPLLFSH